MSRILVAALVLLLPAGALASFGTTDARQILAEQQRIRQEAEAPRGKYSRFNKDAQARLSRAQEVIFTILDTGAVLEELAPPQQVDLMNAVEEVKAVLTENEGDRLECWRERRVGTMMPKTFCETVAKREELREQSQAWKSDTGVCIKESGCRPYSELDR